MHPAYGRARADAEARAAVCAIEYQEIAKDLTGAFSAVSRDVIRVQRELARRAADEEEEGEEEEEGVETGAAAAGGSEYAALATAVAELQKREAEKLALTVRLHQLRWNASQQAEVEATQEGLGEVIDAINELLRDVKISVLNQGTRNEEKDGNDIPRP